MPGEPRAVEGWVNGARRQASSTRHLIFPIDQLVEFITFVMTLEPGDIISTGTPEGIGPLTAGDVVTVTVEGVGSLTNPVQSE
jgi:2-keto-4-pentenoate hydratase/2-oxohepta-3-ene-1,7-dioic acid hydratase in catechol pathway